MTDNLSIWSAVSKTNPDNTKHVSQRGGFTSICAQSQFMEATRQFGPIGIGWGYDADAPIFHEALVFVRVTLWHGSRANVFGPVYRCDERGKYKQAGDYWRMGWSILSPDELLERAARKRAA